MNDETPNVEFVAPLWDLGHGIARRIAELPPDRRSDGFAICESVLRAVAVENGTPTEKIAGLVNLQMLAVRGMVRTIDSDGSAHREQRKTGEFGALRS